MSDKEDKGKEIEIKKDAEKTKEIARRQEHPFSLFEDIDRVFDRVTKRLFDFPYASKALKEFEDRPFFRTPLANVTETEKSYNIAIELPGLDKKNIEMTLQEDKLEIKGESEESFEKEEEGYVRREYNSANYYRAFRLPENVDQDNIDASLDKGVLEVILPKKEIEKKEKKKIDIK